MIGVLVSIDFINFNDFQRQLFCNHLKKSGFESMLVNSWFVMFDDDNDKNSVKVSDVIKDAFNHAKDISEEMTVDNMSSSNVKWVALPSDRKLDNFTLK